ncbi:Nramp family divalent metal transporter [Robiginitalea sp.]|uniref:Nramp family divalent metal transporter n=1 Tax=Robiginitalea sp. TaxID=1902411 RepID=UPI003C70E2E7
MFKNAGPGMLIAAAFVGPGTVTTCIRAGVDWKLGLLWALLLSVGATLVLQEMAGRLGLSASGGIPGFIRSSIGRPLLRILLLGVVLSGIVIGNAAYEAGNISGAVLGLEAIFGSAGTSFFPFLVGVAAFVLLWFGNNRSLERVFITLVLIMSLSFLITAILTRPDFSQLVRGLLIPDIHSDNVLTVVALVGTTVVPYNLFLYTSLVSEKWSSISALPLMRRDIILSVLIGGIVSMSILITAAGSGSEVVSSVMDLAAGLEPVYGQAARYGMGIGLLAAGITSAITAPLAAAFVARQCFGWAADRTDWKFRVVWVGVLMVGVLALTFEIRPLEIIYFAQVANGILLPVVGVFLLWAVNSTRLMGVFKNNRTQNILGLIVLVLVTGLGIWSIFKIFI